MRTLLAILFVWTHNSYHGPTNQLEGIPLAWDMQSGEARKRAGLGQKHQKPSHGGSVLAIKVWAWVEGTILWWGTLGFGCREATIGWGAREGWFDQRTKNQTVEAPFWLVKCRQARFGIERTVLGWGTPDWGAGKARSGEVQGRTGWGQKNKTELWRLGFG